MGSRAAREDMPSPTDAVGQCGEQMAEGLLRLHGLTIRGRRVRCGRGEFDLVAQDGNTLVFVEVKLRRSGGFGGAVSSIDAAKRRRLIQSAWMFLQRMAEPWPPVRFDVVCVTWTPANDSARVEHLRDAFRADPA